MKCFCGKKAWTIDSRSQDWTVWRRKSCNDGHRFSTYERYELTEADKAQDPDGYDVTLRIAGGTCPQPR